MLFVKWRLLFEQSFGKTKIRIVSFVQKQKWFSRMKRAILYFSGCQKWRAVDAVQDVLQDGKKDQLVLCKLELNSVTRCLAFFFTEKKSPNLTENRQNGKKDELVLCKLELNKNFSQILFSYERLWKKKDLCVLKSFCAGVHVKRKKCRG